MDRKRYFDTATGNAVAILVVGAGVVAIVCVANPAIAIAAKAYILSKAVMSLKVVTTGLKVTAMGATVRGIYHLLPSKMKKKDSQ